MKDERRSDPVYRKFFVYLDDGEHVYKVAIAAVSEDAARLSCHGNGEVIAIKDVTDDYPICTLSVRLALKSAGFGEPEIDWICRALAELDITG